MTDALDVPRLLTHEPAPAHAPVRARVLLGGGDRRFRTMAATLLSLRGYDVVAAGVGEDLLARAAAERVEVVVIDASTSLTAAAQQAAGLGALRPRVGVVAVGGDHPRQLRALPVISKWGSIEELQDAIERALPTGVTRGRR